jgi:hypothetical protein
VFDIAAVAQLPGECQPAERILADALGHLI